MTAPALMKITFVSQPLDNFDPSYPSSIGIWTTRISQQLCNDHDVTMYAKMMRSYHGEIASPMFFVPALPNRAWLFCAHWLSKVSRRKRPFISSVLYHLEYISQIAVAARLKNADLVHIHNFSQFVPVVRMVNPHAKIVLHMHSEWLSQLDRNLVRSRLKETNLIIGCSHHVTGAIRSSFPEYAHKCHTLHNGVDLDAFPEVIPSRTANRQPQIAFLGRLSPEKGVHVLMDAYKIVRQKLPDVRIKLIGSGGSLPLEFLVQLSDDPKVQALENLYDQDYVTFLQEQIPTGASHDVLFTGPVPHHEVGEQLRDVDVLVNPSFSEAFGMSLVEAMAMNIPVVASHVGGMQEILIEGQTGLFVPAGDAHELAKAILMILETDSLPTGPSRKAREIVKQYYSWEHIAKNLIKMYENI